MYITVLSRYFFAQDAGNDEDNKFTARIKISGPEQFFCYILHLANLLLGIAVFSILTAMVPSYVDKMTKVDSAAGISMAAMIYAVGPTTLALSALSKLLYHATAETWKIVEGGEKWTRQQFIPKPKGKIKLKQIAIPEVETADNVPAEIIEILDTIQERRN